jgi:hypothetical protein
MISLSDIRFTEREVRTVRETVDKIRKENRKESPRRLRISNLCDRLSFTIANAERRTSKMIR